ncbi:hypothetical protein J2Z22_002376 [Paenibacillus forsythiae]|uniref:Uncharacterized protein n=1 Tax=Paenibacillus forsythiae TaxID=365616 RepID=A0ABU3H9Y3_9BACL|nr:hypothetical protein [Paenibacillus forsythiae]
MIFYSAQNIAFAALLAYDPNLYTQKRHLASGRYSSTGAIPGNIVSIRATD